jgi:hypothetical protein
VPTLRGELEIVTDTPSGVASLTEMRTFSENDDIDGFVTA